VFLQGKCNPHTRECIIVNKSSRASKGFLPEVYVFVFSDEGVLNSRRPAFLVSWNMPMKENCLPAERPESQCQKFKAFAVSIQSIHIYTTLCTTMQCSWPRSHTVLGKLLALAHFKVPVDWRLKIAHYVFIDIFSPRLRFSGTNPGFEAWSTLKFGWIEDWRFAAIFDPVGFQACLFQTDDCWISLRLVKSPSKTREEGGSYCKTIKLMWSPQQEIAKLHWSTTDQELDKAWDNALTTKAWSNGQVWSFSPEPYWRVTSEALTACWSWRDSLQHSIE
jgi:hypothetical protein